MPKDQRRHDDDDDDRGNDFSDTSSSVATIDSDEEERRRERRRKKSKKSHRRSRDDSDSDERRHHRHSKSDKKKKRHKKSSKSKRKKDRKRHKNYDDNSSYDSRSDDENDSNYSRRRRHKRKERKRRRKEDAGERKKSRTVIEDGVKESTPPTRTRGQIIAKALHHLLADKAGFASELPLILIRLAGGTTFDLRQVTDPSIAQGLQDVFEALETFGVKRQESSGMWMFQNPPGATRRDELVLLRVVRSLLDDVGLTMDKVIGFDAQQSRVQKQPQPALETDGNLREKEEQQKMKELTFKILEKFRSKDATLGSQLASLCMTIVEGESVSVDGIPDEDLKAALESLFQACGLEKSEIEEDDDDEEEDDDDDESNESLLMGYGLPAEGSPNNDTVQMKLATIMAACREGPPKPKSIGPMRRPTTEEEVQAANAMYASNNAEDEDDEGEGPLLPGEARKARGPTMSLDMIKAQAEYRELELKSTSAGVPMPTNNGGREEWMINPGQHDFLSGIKSGQAIKSRGFQNKKSRGEKEAPQVHPAVQAEMDAIMQAHENARGPSLIDLHRAKISQEKELASKSGNGKKEFNWSRDKDLDAGRRVDKDALGMILGGAAENLKTKFAGGFNR